MDCSWPPGASLNDGISKDYYLGEKIQLRYPTVDALARKVFELKISADGPVEILFFKEDLDRAFRQIFACPSSVPLLGFKWRGQFYFDVVMVMGCRIAPFVCQRVTNLISWIYKQMTYFILNYVDDFVSIDYKHRVFEAHRSFINLLQAVGVSRSLKKSVSPTPIIEFIGNLFNSIDMTIGITERRRTDILLELERWHFKKMTTRT